MAGLRLTCACMLDGTTVPGFPYSRRISVDNVVDVTRTRAGDGVGVTTYTELVPTTESSLRSALVIPDAALLLALNGVPPNVAALPIAANGMLAFHDGFATANTGHLVAANPTATTANVDALEARDR